MLREVQMINKPVALGIPISILIAVLFAAILADFQPGLPRDARAELDRYLGFEQGKSGIRPVVRQIVPATWPGRFTAPLSGTSYGDSAYYRTTNHYREPVIPLRETRGATGIDFFSVSGRPLPFPPERLWCVIVDPGTLGARRPVFVALHQDLYNADWIVHVPPHSASGAELSAALDTLGCAATSR
jgi:hypothetical protein